MAVKRPQPCKNAVVRKQTRRAIAKKLVQRKAPTAIAKELGISRQMVNNHIREPETQAFIRDAMAPYLDELKELIPGALAAVRAALDPEQETVDRLRGVKALTDLMHLAEGRDTDGNATDRPRWQGQYEDLLILHHRTINVGQVPEAR